MSYDLYLKNKENKIITENDFVNYFQSQNNYTIDKNQAIYGNENTGVYFVVDYNSEKGEEDDEYYPFSININYLRPSIFGLESSIEIQKIVNNFDLDVFDPQTNGMGKGNYNKNSFLDGWNKGNEFGYSTLKDKKSEDLFFLNSERIEYAWNWNYKITELYEELKDDIFIPRIMFANYQNSIKSIIVWGDGIPINIPEVDYVVLIKKELSSRFLFKKQEISICNWKDVEYLLKDYEVKNINKIKYYHLKYISTPKNIIDFFKKQKVSNEQFNVISIDMILDKEIYDKVLK